MVLNLFSMGGGANAPARHLEKFKPTSCLSRQSQRELGFGLILVIMLSKMNRPHRVNGS